MIAVFQFENHFERYGVYSNQVSHGEEENTAEGRGQARIAPKSPDCRFRVLFLEAGRNWRDACGVLKLSVKSDYAARAVLALAKRHGSNEPVRTDEIARESGVPPNYLVQILIELKTARIVRSQRGKEGGYLLARAPAEISLGDVLRAVQTEVFESPASRDPACPPELREAWKRLVAALEAEANRIHFAQLQETGEARGRMFYI
jgi:Rrf2 family protein